MKISTMFAIGAGAVLAAVMWLRRLPLVKLLRMTRKAFAVPWKLRGLMRFAGR